MPYRTLVYLCLYVYRSIHVDIIYSTRRYLVCEGGIRIKGQQLRHRARQALFTGPVQRRSPKTKDRSLAITIISSSLSRGRHAHPHVSVLRAPHAPPLPPSSSHPPRPTHTRPFPPALSLRRAAPASVPTPCPRNSHHTRSQHPRLVPDLQVQGARALGRLH
jgi:hypothetical protein